MGAERDQAHREQDRRSLACPDRSHQRRPVPDSDRCSRRPR
jgi:hypothetical protein